MSVTTKLVQLCLNLFFWIGAVLIALLLFIHHERELDIPIAKMEHFKLPLDLNIMILFLLALTGTIGFVTIVANEERKKIHMTIFSSILILLTLLLGSVSYLEYYNRSFITTEYLAQFDASIVHYNETGNSTQSPNHEIYDAADVDRIQVTFTCCGSTDFTDYSTSDYATEHPGQVPISCCNETAASPGRCANGDPLSVEDEEAYINSAGCHAIIESVFLHWLDTLIVVQAFIAIFTTIAICGSAYWIRRARSQRISYNVLPGQEEDDELIE